MLFPLKIPQIFINFINSFLSFQDNKNKKEMIDDFTRGRVYQLAQEMLDGKKMSMTTIAKQVGVTRKTVKNILLSPLRLRRTCTRRKRAPSPGLAKRRRCLLQLAGTVCRKGHRTWPKYGSSRQLRAGLKEKTGELLSRRQIQREMKSLGLKPYVRQATTTRNPLELRKRKIFAKRMRSVGPKYHKRICFSDESWLTCNEATGRIQYARRKHDVQRIERKARWNTPSIMVFACVGRNYKSPLIIFPSKKRTEDGELLPFRLDAKSYVRRCLTPIAADLATKKKVFQQDGARSHASKVTTAYLKRKCLEWLEDWPPYSADWNAIERVWHELISRVGMMCPLTQEELIEAAKKAWDEIPQAVINQHCKHFTKQMEEYI